MTALHTVAPFRNRAFVVVPPPYRAVPPFHSILFFFFSSRLSWTSFPKLEGSAHPEPQSIVPIRRMADVPVRDAAALGAVEPAAAAIHAVRTLSPYIY